MSAKKVIDWAEELPKIPRKEIAVELAKTAIKYPQANLEPLVKTIQSKEKHAPRGAWIFRQIAIIDPETARPFLPFFIDVLHNLQPDGIQRDILKSIDVCGIPDDKMGTLADLCLTFLATPFKAVAVKYLSMGLLDQVCKEWPELQREYLLTLQETMPNETKSFQRQASKRLERHGSRI